MDAADTLCLRIVKYMDCMRRRNNATCKKKASVYQKVVLTLLY